MNYDAATRGSLFKFLLQLGDDRLVLGHRLSEWCGHAPVLEEDIALTNIALDEIGQSAEYLRLAGVIEGKDRDEDDLAYFREATQFRNVQLVEQPNGDFAATIVRQFFFDVYDRLLLVELQRSEEKQLADISAKALKEATYHLRHSTEWMLRMGRGTDESRERLQSAVNDLWRFTGELFQLSEIERSLSTSGILPRLDTMEAKWNRHVVDLLQLATLLVPTNDILMVSGSRSGKHGEHLGHLLAEMQIVARSFPEAQW